MYWLIALMSLSLIVLVGVGVFYVIRPRSRELVVPRWWGGAIGMNLFTFMAAQVGLLFLAMGDAMAQEVESAAAAPPEISMGMGLALLAVGLPTAVATVAAAYAVGTVGASALAAISEKPELFGRTLIYLGLAEGIAIYGVVVTILMLGKI
ncbi:ATP synthase subunit C [Nitrosococcus wardiae]|uniref:ATPase n=1 Tax=Nitrosococcus wardiae TaxID=1814290 RepID=A0A4P7BXL7_9GAMM|nr:ATP synthase subunit C [Nitrosococcus wardiae]QBQ53136.1 ATPase [Nitrosococcus wardiae]